MKSNIITCVLAIGIILLGYWNIGMEEKKQIAENVESDYTSDSENENIIFVEKEDVMSMAWEDADLSGMNSKELTETQKSVVYDICKAQNIEDEINVQTWYEETQDLYILFPTEDSAIAFSPTHGYFAYVFGTIQNKGEEEDVDDMFQQFVYQNLWFAHRLQIQSSFYINEIAWDILQLDNVQLQNEDFFTQAIQSADWWKYSYCTNMLYNGKYRVAYIHKAYEEYIWATYNNEKKQFTEFKMYTR